MINISIMNYNILLSMIIIIINFYYIRNLDAYELMIY